MQKRFQKFGFFLTRRETTNNKTVEPENKSNTVRILYKKDLSEPSSPREKSPRNRNKVDLKAQAHPKKYKVEESSKSKKRVKDPVEQYNEKYIANPTSKKAKSPAADTAKKPRNNTKHGGGDETTISSKQPRKSYIKESHSEHIVTNKEHHHTHKSRKNTNKESNKHGSYWLTKREILDLINQRVPSDTLPNQKFFVFDRRHPPADHNLKCEIVTDSGKYIEGQTYAHLKKLHKEEKPIEVVYTRKSRKKDRERIKEYAINTMDDQKRSRSTPVDQSSYSYSKTSEQTVQSGLSKKKSTKNRSRNPVAVISSAEESKEKVSRKSSRYKTRKLSKIHMILVDIPGETKTDRVERKKRNHLFRRYYERHHHEDGYNYQTYSDSNKKFASISEEESSSSGGKKPPKSQLRFETYTASVVVRPPNLNERPGKVHKKSRLGLYKSKIPIWSSSPTRIRNGKEVRETGVEVDLIGPQEKPMKVKRMKESATSPFELFEDSYPPIGTLNMENYSKIIAPKVAVAKTSQHIKNAAISRGNSRETARGVLGVSVVEKKTNPRVDTKKTASDVDKWKHVKPKVFLPPKKRSPARSPPSRSPETLNRFHNPPKERKRKISAEDVADGKKEKVVEIYKKENTQNSIEKKKKAPDTREETVVVKKDDSQPTCKTFSSHQYFKKSGQTKVTTTSDLDAAVKPKRSDDGEKVDEKRRVEKKESKSRQKSDVESNKSHKSAQKSDGESEKSAKSAAKSDSDSNKSGKSKHKSEVASEKSERSKQKSDVESPKSGKSREKSDLGSTGTNKSEQAHKEPKKHRNQSELQGKHSDKSDSETKSDRKSTYRSRSSSDKHTNKTNGHISFTSSKSDTNIDQKSIMHNQNIKNYFERQSTHASFSNSTFGERSMDSNKNNNTSFLFTKTYRDEDKINRWHKRKMYSDLVRKNLLEKTINGSGNNKALPQQVMEIHFVSVAAKSSSDKEGVTFVEVPPLSPLADCFKNDLPHTQKPIEVLTNDQFEIMFGSPIDKAFEEILKENNQFLNKDFRMPSPIVLVSSDEEDKLSVSKDWIEYPSPDDPENVNKVYYCNERFNPSSETTYAKYITSDDRIEGMSKSKTKVELMATNLDVDSSCSAPGSEESGYATIKSKSFFRKPNIRALFDPPSEETSKQKEVQTEGSSICSGDLFLSGECKSLQTVIDSSQKSIQFNISQEIFDESFGSVLNFSTGSSQDDEEEEQDHKEDVCNEKGASGDGKSVKKGRNWFRRLKKFLKRTKKTTNKEVIVYFVV